MKRFLINTLLVCIALVYSSLATAKETACKSQLAILDHSDHFLDTKFMCYAADRAAIYLFHLDLLPNKTIHIEVTDKPIVINGNHAYGIYDARSDKVTIMSYAAIFAHSRDPRMFGEPMDKVHYLGVIAHEVAHAIVQQNATDRVGASSHEYLAYATQLRVMPAGRRNTILRHMAVEGWTPGDAISETYLAMKPGKFAAKSFLHINSLPDPTLFIKILLETTHLYVNVPEFPAAIP